MIDALRHTLAQHVPTAGLWSDALAASLSAAAAADPIAKPALPPSVAASVALAVVVHAESAEALVEASCDAVERLAAQVAQAGPPLAQIAHAAAAAPTEAPLHRALVAVVGRTRTLARVHARTRGLLPRVSVDSFERRLQNSLVAERLRAGRSGKVAQGLPERFASHERIVLRYPLESIDAERAFEDAFARALPVAVEERPGQYDTHLSVAATPGADGGDMLEVEVARLWRTAEQVARIPALSSPAVAPSADLALQLSLPSRIEATLRRRVSLFRGLLPQHWDQALAEQVRAAQRKHDATIDVPFKCHFVRHGTLSFSRWPLETLLGFVTLHPFWNTGIELECPGLSHHAHFRYALAVVPEVPPGLPDGPPGDTLVSITLCLAVAWAHQGADDTLIPADSLPDADSAATSPLSVGETLTDGAVPKLEHYNMDPALVPGEMRAMLWPSLIAHDVLLGTKTAAANPFVVRDFGITAIVDCYGGPPVHRDKVDYLILSESESPLKQHAAVRKFVLARRGRGQRFLVAGKRGRSQAAGVAALVIAWLADMDVDVALHLVATRRDGGVSLSERAAAELVGCM